MEASSGQTAVRGLPRELPRSTQAVKNRRAVTCRAKRPCRKTSVFRILRIATKTDEKIEAEPARKSLTD
jgi:hypothetical protein